LNSWENEMFSIDLAAAVFREYTTNRECPRCLFRFTLGGPHGGPFMDITSEEFQREAVCSDS